MSRGLLRLVVLLAAVCGAVVGGLVTLLVATPQPSMPPAVPLVATGAHDHPPSAQPTPSGRPTPQPAPSTPAATVAPERATTPSDRPTTRTAGGILLVWTAGGLPEAVVAAATGEETVTEVSVVRGDQAGLVTVTDRDGRTVLALDDGWRIPLDVLAVDPGDHAPFVAPDARAALADLEAGEGLLSTTSAAVRGVGAGALLTLVDGVQIRVGGVLDDLSLAGAELVVHRADAARLGIDRPRYLLVAHDGPRAAVQQRLAAAVGVTPVRFRSPAETTWLRHGDAVLPQVLLKQAFGEFAIRDLAGRDVEVDPAWEEAHITTAEVAILGAVRCHRQILPRLDAAMAELARNNLAHLVDAAAFAGCYAPRRIAPGEPLSRHSWGVAVDLNVGDNPRGSFSTQDPRLVEVMRAHGFTWGGTWLVPDPAHHEVVTTEEW